MRIEFVLAKDVGDFRGTGAAQEDVSQREVEREIEDRCDSRIDAVPATLAAGEEGSHFGIRMKDFADGGEAGIDGAQTGVPVGPKAARHVRKSVHAETV